MVEKKVVPSAYKTTDSGKTWEKEFKDIPHMILNMHKFRDSYFATGTRFILEIDPATNAWDYVVNDTTGVIGQIRSIRFTVENKVLWLIEQRAVMERSTQIQIVIFIKNNEFSSKKDISYKFTYSKIKPHPR